jgi:phosphomannomutase
VRSSNTEPIMRIAAEAKSEERMEELYRHVMGMLEAG